MLTTFLKSLIPMVDAVAVGLPELRAEAHAFAEALRKYTGGTVSVDPSGPPPDPGLVPTTPRA